MILPDFKAFPRIGRIVGIDWGARRTGIAVSDASRGFVFVRPPVVMRAPSDVWAQRVADIALAEGAVGIVIGLPLHADGTESQTAADVRTSAVQISKITDLPIAFIAENLTSHAAQENMGRVRIHDIKEKLDSESARVILENAIAVMNRM